MQKNEEKNYFYSYGIQNQSKFKELNYRDYENGGLRLINLEHLIYSLKASWLERILK